MALARYESQLPPSTCNVKMKRNASFQKFRQILSLFFLLNILITIILNLRAFHRIARTEDLALFHKPLRNNAWGSIVHYSFAHPRSNSTAPQSGASLAAKVDLRNDLTLSLDTLASRRAYRICIITFEFSPLTQSGGIGTAYRELSEALANAGHDVTVAIPAHNVAFSIDTKTGQWKDYVKEDLERANFSVKIIDSSSYHVKPSYFAANSFHVTSWLASQSVPFDYVHVPENQGMAFASSQLKNLGLAFPNTEFISTLHGASSWAMLLSGSFPTKLDQLEEFLYEKNQIARTLVVSPSSYMVDYLKKRGQEFRYTPVVIPNILSVDIPHESDSIVDETPFCLQELVFFGRLESRKGLVLFIDALNLLAEGGFPFDKVAITFLGRSMTLDEALETSEVMIRETHSSSGWRSAQLKVLTGLKRKDALKYIMAKGRLVVIPSLNDNSPYAVAECLALGVNFIASRVGGIPELINQKDIELVTFSPPTYASLARKIMNIHLQPSGFRRARPRWHRENIRRKWLQLHDVIHKESLQLKAHQRISDDTSMSSSNSLEPLKEYGSRQPLSVVIVAPNGTVDGLLQATLLSVSAQEDVRIVSITIVSPTLKGCEDAANLCKLLGSTHSPTMPSFTNEIISSVVSSLTGNVYAFIQAGELLASPDSLHQMAIAMSTSRADMILPYAEHFVPSRGDIASLVMLDKGIDDLEETVRSMMTRSDESPAVFAYVGPDSALGLLDASRLSHGFLYIHRSLRNILSVSWALEGYSLQQFALQLCMRLANSARQRRAEVLPRPLIKGIIPGVRADSSSVQDSSLKEFMNEMQGMAPYLDQVGDDRLVDYILYQHGVAEQARRDSEDSHVVADSIKDFGGQQGMKGWLYGLKTNLSGKLTHTSTGTDSDYGGSNLFYYRAGWYFADIPKKHPLFTPRILHPIASKDLRYIATKRFLSPVAFSSLVRIDLEYWGTCGDGVIFTAQLDGNTLVQRNLTSPYKRVLELRPHFKAGSTLDLNVDPKENDWCDSTIVHATVMHIVGDMSLKGESRDLSQALRDHSSTIAAFPPPQLGSEEGQSSEKGLIYGFASGYSSEHTLGSCFRSSTPVNQSRLFVRKGGSFIGADGVRPYANLSSRTSISPCLSVRLEHATNVRLHLVAEGSNGDEPTADGVAVIARAIDMGRDHKIREQKLLRYYVPPGESLHIASDTLPIRARSQLDIIIFPLGSSGWDYTPLSFRVLRELPDGSDPLPVSYANNKNTRSSADESSPTILNANTKDWIRRVASGPKLKLFKGDLVDDHKILTSVLRTWGAVDRPSPYCVLHGFERQDEGLQIAEFVISLPGDVYEMIHAITNGTDPLRENRVRTISFKLSRSPDLKRGAIRTFFDIGVPFLLRSKKVRSFALFSTDRAQTGSSFLNGWYGFRAGPRDDEEVRSKFKKLLEEPKFVKYFATQHYSSKNGHDHYNRQLDSAGIYNHPKIRPVPVGASNCNAFSQKLREIRSDLPNFSLGRRKTLYVNMQLHSRRRKGFLQLKNASGLALENRYGQSMGDYLRDLLEHKLVWSPPGGGVDCYRHYEALMMGAVPVVERHPLVEKLLKNMPVLWYNDPTELTTSHLNREYERINRGQYDLRSLFSRYWRLRIEDDLYGI